MHVDYDSQLRTVKRSGHVYAEIIRAHRDAAPTPAGQGIAAAI